MLPGPKPGKDHSEDVKFLAVVGFDLKGSSAVSDEGERPAKREA
jgi:hypothetical protein